MTNDSTHFSFVSSFPTLDFYSATTLLHMMAHAFEGLSFPVAVVSRTGEIYHVNRRMAELIHQGTLVYAYQGNLCFHDEIENKKFQSAANNLLLTKTETSGSEAVTIADGESGQQFIAVFRKLASYVSLAGAVSDNAVVVSLTTPLRVGPIGVDDLQDIFELSLREAEIANRVLAGEQVEVMARDLEVSVSTVRSRLKAVLRKTGCRGQAELVEILQQLRNAL